MTVSAVDHQDHGEIAGYMHSFVLIPDDISKLKFWVFVAVLDEREALVLINFVVVSFLVILLVILLLLALNQLALETLNH